MNNTYCIGSSYDYEYWYESNMIDNLAVLMDLLGYEYEVKADIRFHILGLSLDDTYDDMPTYDSSKYNIAYVIDKTHINNANSLKKFDKIIVPSENCRKALGVDAEVIPHFPLLKPVKRASPKKQFDIVYVGDIRQSKIVEDILPIVSDLNLNFKIFGRFFELYSGSEAAKRCWAGHSINYEYIPSLASKTSIIIHGSRPEMNKAGYTNAQYTDYLTSKAFVISEKNAEIEDLYKGITYGDKSELRDLVTYFLKNPSNRRKHINMQYKLIKDMDLLNTAKDRFKKILER